LGGLVCDWACKRLGPSWAVVCRRAAGLLLIAVLLLVGTPRAQSLHGRRAAVAVFRLHAFTDCIYWQACTLVAGPHTAAATGVLNTGGSLPGLLGAGHGLMVDRLGWMPTFASGSVFAWSAWCCG